VHHLGVRVEVGDEGGDAAALRGVDQVNLVDQDDISELDLVNQQLADAPVVLLLNLLAVPVVDKQTGTARFRTKVRNEPECPGRSGKLS
jgi:hypothetical protein